MDGQTDENHQLEMQRDRSLVNEKNRMKKHTHLSQSSDERASPDLYYTFTF
jgi:hypothetical protein